MVNRISLQPGRARDIVDKRVNKIFQGRFVYNTVMHVSPQVHATHEIVTKIKPLPPPPPPPPPPDPGISLYHKFVLLDVLDDQGPVSDTYLYTDVDHVDHLGCISPCSGKALSSVEMDT